MPKSEDYRRFVCVVVGENPQEVIAKYNATLEVPSYIKYKVAYEDGIPIEANHILRAETERIIRVDVYYEKNISNDDLPDTEQTLNFETTINFTQATSSAVEKPIYRYTTGTTERQIGSEFQSDSNTYNSLLVARTYFPHDFALRYLIDDGIIMESAVAIMNSAGDIFIIGGDNGAAYDDNAAALQKIFTTCSTNSGGIICTKTGLFASALRSGEITVGDGSWYCAIDINGKSSCNQD